MARRVKPALPGASRIRRSPVLSDEAPEPAASTAAEGVPGSIYSDNSEESGASGVTDVISASIEVLIETADSNEQIAGDEELAPAESTDDDFISADSFDEAGYLRLNPDVRIAIESGQLTSGYSHYFWHGKAEGRVLPDTPREARNVMLTSAQDAAQTDVFSKEARCSVEALIIAPEAGMMIVGWIDDASHPLSCIRVIGPGWRVVIDASRLLRVRRTDVESAVGGSLRHAFGFIGFLQFDRGGGGSGPMRIELWQAGGFATVKEHAAAFMPDVELRDTILAHVAAAAFFGSPSIECMNYLERGLGAELVQFNKAITRRIVSSPYVERFGPQGRAPRGTIVVCLHGKAEFFFLQNCLFAGLPGIQDYEFVYVSNSPELAETLLREAHSADLIYGLANSVVILPGNAGFGAANNAAARIARSDRLLVVNPDVFPRDRDWARKHTELLRAVPAAQSRLFGVPLYYDDGSLMHGGIYFEIDVGLSLSGGQPSPSRQCRTQHYGKGAPPGSLQFNRPRPVPAVTGAFISIERAWYERLGGFTEDFIFGHYEDADLCLKSIAKGTVPWIHDIRLWHLEGKGSTRRAAHEGGSIVNRWLFSKTWMPMIEDGLLGPAPTHALLQVSDATTPLASVDDQAKRKVVMHKRVS